MRALEMVYYNIGFVFIRCYIQSLISYNYRSKIAFFMLHLILFKRQQLLILHLNIFCLWLILNIIVYLKFL